ncbi:MAG: magnesium/cobalt transporter CorA [Anaerolineae bacterium]
MFRSLYFTPDKTVQSDLPLKDLPLLTKSKRGLLWVDFSGEAPEACQPILEQFGFHPLAIDDALQERHTPKVDDWGDYLYLVLDTLHLLNAGPSGWETESEELDVFLGRNFVVTHHDWPIPAVEEVWANLPRDLRTLQEGADHLLYKIIDRLTSDYMQLVEQLDIAIGEIEDEVFDQPTRSTLERLFSLKRALQTMRRIITPQRELMNKLARDDFAVIDPRDRIFFRDVYDHMVRLHDLNESLRDLVSAVLDTYLSVINNRMNEVMKTLTIITTLFMPLTFVTGFFGMNFFESTGLFKTWTGAHFFYPTLASMIFIPIGMYYWMRRRTWL